MQHITIQHKSKYTVTLKDTIHYYEQNKGGI